MAKYIFNIIINININVFSHDSMYEHNFSYCIQMIFYSFSFYTILNTFKSSVCFNLIN